jgi:acyl-CoA thioester hydrolase
MGNILYYKLKVKNYDIDSYGHVNNAVYIQYLEDARTYFLEKFNLYLSDLKDNGISIMISEIKIKYKTPTFLGDILEISGQFSIFTRVKSTWHHYIRRGKELIAEAFVSCAYVQNNHVIPIPEDIYKAFYPYLYKEV